MVGIGIICPSEIAYRRFMPALQSVKEFRYVGLGVYNAQERFGDQDPSDSIDLAVEAEYKKARAFTEQFGGKIFNSYESVVTSNEVDAVYLPLPPALHFQWAKKALENGKHVLSEKPLTLSLDDTVRLIEIAKSNKLALHENYMFIFHNQLNALNDIIKSGEIGEVRLYRISFGFPRRNPNDFRYNQQLGGGALYDAGGYTLKYAAYLLGDTASLSCAHLNYADPFKVDLYGSATMINSDGVTAQIAFGMDNQYKCELEVWGSKGILKTGRVLTAPVGFVPEAIIEKGNDVQKISLPADDSFGKSIRYFLSCINDNTIREETYSKLFRQTELVEQFKQMARKEG